MLLIIGATGHTGKYLLEELNKHNYKEKIRFFIRNEEKKKIFESYNLNYEVMIGDLKNEEDVKKACEEIDTIFEIYNIRYSTKVLDAALLNKVKRIIFVHTTGIYSKHKMASEEYKIIEKKVIEKAKNKIDITILRPTMIYGDICDHNIAKFIKMLDKVKIFPMIAGGKAKIQPVNARDLGVAYYQVLVNENITRNKDYNLSGKTEIEIKDMLKIISSKLNKKTIFITIPLSISVLFAYVIKIFSFGKVDIVEKTLRMNETRIFSYEKAKKDYDYNPMPLNQGLDMEIKQYLDNTKKN